MKENYSDEIILIHALKKGNEKAYQFLMNQYFKKMCAYANTLCQNHDQAEDIVQNVFLKIWKNRANLDKIQKLSSFLYKSVYNEFLDQYRQSKKVITLEKKHIDILSTILEEETETNLNNLILLVNKEIDSLPPKSKEVMLLSKKEGLTNIEISEYLKISLKAVESHITKAYKIIKKKLMD